MARKRQDTGVFQLANGDWGYRFRVNIDGKNVDRRRGRDDTPDIHSKGCEYGSRCNCRYTGRDCGNYDIFHWHTEWLEHQRTNSKTKQNLNGNKSHRQNDACAKISCIYYDREFSFTYVESFLKIFYLIFGQAYSRGYLETTAYHRLCLNKDTKIHMPKRRTNDDDEIIVFTEEECAVMDEYFKGKNAETAYMLGRYCGLRTGHGRSDCQPANRTAD